jgi:BirA family biotin operon repressor/biotin-[acetyl-CoA-carboxylase] ligase
MAAVCSWAVRWDVHYVEQTASTNADLLALARAGAAPGTVVRAGVQTAGRGRLGRRWEAPPGTSLLASILLESEPVPFALMARVALAAGDACLTLAGVTAALKWPNDLLVGDRKLAGLLAEADGFGQGVVVGIGLNVAWPPSAELPQELREVVVALSHLSDVVPDAADLLDGLLGRLAGWLERPAGEVLAAYRSRCATLGRPVTVALPDRLLEGVATGITPTGELEVVVGGRRHAVRTGDVVHVRAK